MEQEVAWGSGAGNSEEARSPRVCAGAGKNLGERSSRLGKSNAPAGQRGLAPRESCAILLPQGPRPADPASQSRGSWGKPLALAPCLAPPPRSPRASPPPATLQAPCLREAGSLHARAERELWRWFPRAGGGKAHGECLAVSPRPHCCGKGEGRRRRTSLLGRTTSIPKPGRPVDGGESQGNPGRFPGNPSATGSLEPHTEVTMTIQPQPPVAMAAVHPIRLLSFLFSPCPPGSTQSPLTVSLRTGGGASEKPRGSFASPFSARGKIRDEGLAGGTVGRRHGVSGSMFPVRLGLPPLAVEGWIGSKQPSATNRPLTSSRTSTTQLADSKRERYREPEVTRRDRCR
ncbi:translation initiation factor IF-2-like [Elephas maximus indicus]|uniref:translation initiation factor IF-2-like n=1 Tax=Elephas maximus indicus TaxID=99487 RepID=UPI002115CE74|nr:translation initiation factor IF-2-like [Elephas maximus indicus]